MNDLILIKYLHFIAIFGVVGSLITEQFMIDEKLTKKDIKRLSFVDAVYGISAVLVLVAGFTLWFGVGKPAEFYTKNWIFHTKVTLFIIVGILSIYPTVFFLKKRKGDDIHTIIHIPKIILWSIRIELLLVFVIPLLAILMALGIGRF
ncbi:DUF2214 family protein [Flexithrix dorotheae]|uniref:DUF2214 family protein n=1 Tax=Flexithrix dorotheae TaxID=70993 RepID=UPI000373FA8B|nr:DUF2214 family protein [Flexithrix dorotheae]